MSVSLAGDTVDFPAAESAYAVAPDLAARALAVRYGEFPPVFSGVSFAVRPGEAVSLVGANGAGKSTLLKCMLGLIRPHAGELTLFGQPVGLLAGGPQRRLRSQIGFVAQKHNLVPRLSVLSNVLHGLLAARPGPRYWVQSLSPREARQRGFDALHRLGLADLALRRADSLSGGQSQRVAIARALVSEPRLLLADETAASLDPAAGEEVMETFARVVSETGTTLVFTTHNVDHARRYSGRVLGLRDGSLTLDTAAARLDLGTINDLYG